jgi:glycoprotein 6-alpha-L-fucosyltransferase
MQNPYSRVDDIITIAAGLFKKFQNARDQKEAMRVGDLVQRRIRYLQNPKDCKAANKLVCDTRDLEPQSCGYGCSIHAVVVCLISAYASNRTLILQSKGWNYSTEHGWEAYFRPLSDTCTTRGNDPVVQWDSDNNSNNTIKVIQMPMKETKTIKYKVQDVVAFPTDLLGPLRFLRDPFAWWVGQFVKYVTRPNDALILAIEQRRNLIGFRSPVVGMHVRKTDKLRVEAN